MDIKLFLKALSKEEYTELIHYILSNHNKMDISTWVDMQPEMSTHLKNIMVNYKYGENNTPFPFLEDVTINKFKRLRGIGPKTTKELLKFLIFRTADLQSGMVYDKKLDRFIRKI